MRHDIFISYRREDGLWTARALFYYLRHLGLDCFFDFDGIHKGDFDQKLKDEISGSRYFLTLLTPEALSAASEQKNWFREELEIAIAYKDHDHILPVVFKGKDVSLSDDPSGAIRSIDTVNRHILDEGVLFEKSVQHILSNCTELQGKTDYANRRKKERTLRVFRKKVLGYYRNAAMSHKERTQKIRSLQKSYSIPELDADEIINEVCDSIQRAQNIRAWRLRHPFLVFLLVCIVLVCLLWCAAHVWPAFGRALGDACHWVARTCVNLFSFVRRSLR